MADTERLHHAVTQAVIEVMSKEDNALTSVDVRDYFTQAAKGMAHISAFLPCNEDFIEILELEHG